jgi:hypothetical protein
MKLKKLIIMPLLVFLPCKNIGVPLCGVFHPQHVRKQFAKNANLMYIVDNQYIIHLKYLSFIAGTCLRTCCGWKTPHNGWLLLLPKGRLTWANDIYLAGVSLVKKQKPYKNKYPDTWQASGFGEYVVKLVFF